MSASHARVARRPPTRFPLALAASAGLHILLSAAPLDLPGGSTGSPLSYPLSVRLALPRPSLVADQPSAVQTAAAQVATGASHAASRGGKDVERRTKVAPERQRAAVTADVPMHPDPAVYAVHELDVLPRPVHAIEIAPPGTTPYRIELVIDERGIVQRLALLSPAAPERLQRKLQTAVGEKRFVPARKDGRAVRSRVILEVSSGTDARAP